MYYVHIPTGFSSEQEIAQRQTGDELLQLIRLCLMSDVAVDSTLSQLTASENMGMQREALQQKISSYAGRFVIATSREIANDPGHQPLREVLEERVRVGWQRRTATPTHTPVVSAAGILSNTLNDSRFTIELKPRLISPERLFVMEPIHPDTLAAQVTLRII